MVIMFKPVGEEKRVSNRDLVQLVYATWVSRQGQTLTSRLSSVLFQSVKLRDLRTIGFAGHGQSRQIPDRRVWIITKEDGDWKG